jgi:flagellar biosynthesis/type III secretory pathway M-ring protein FliF/YscJ
MTIQSLMARFAALPQMLRFAALGGLAVVALAAIVIGAIAHAPRVSLFASPLHPEQLSEVEERLAEWSGPFTPTDDNVIVDAAKRNDLLLRLSLAGVPHPHLRTSDEALANVGVLTPQAVIDAQTRAGLAGDIEAGLRGVAGVDDARVIIAPARTAEFADESSRDATASVRLQLHSGEQLDRSAIAGIRAFVAASVAGLDPARVTILDDRGLALGDGSDAGDAAGLQQSLQSALDSAFGSGVTIVRVHVEYDRATTERRDVQRAAVSALPVAQTTTSETYDGAGKRYEKHDENDDRGSDTHETVTRSEAGGLARLSTAVFVDASRAVDTAKVRELAAATVGFDARRGDTLAVQAIDFRRALQPKRDGWWLLYGVLTPLLPTLALVIGAVVIVRLALPSFTPILRQYASRASLERTSRTVAGYAPAQVRGALQHEPPHAAAAIISALPAATAAAVLELYPPHEREAIIRRMQRPHSTLFPDAEEILGRHA